jgi:hypothetical protein
LIPAEKVQVIFTRNVPPFIQKQLDKKKEVVEMSFLECPFSNELCSQIAKGYIPGYIGHEHALFSRVLSKAEQEQASKANIPATSEDDDKPQWNTECDLSRVINF